MVGRARPCLRRPASRLMAPASSWRMAEDRLDALAFGFSWFVRGKLTGACMIYSGTGRSPAQGRPRRQRSAEEQHR